MNTTFMPRLCYTCGARASGLRTQAEVAQILGMQTSAVDKCEQRALRKIRAKLALKKYHTLRNELMGYVSGKQ